MLPSTAKQDLVRSLGADHVLDYTRDDWANGTQRYDLILDIAGNPRLSRLRRALTRTGTAVLVGGEDGGDLTGGMNRSLRALMLSPLVSQRFAWFVAKEGNYQRPRTADAPPRVRRREAQHRPRLPARRRTRRVAPPRDRAGPRQGRDHHLIRSCRVGLRDVGPPAVASKRPPAEVP